MPPNPMVWGLSFCLHAVTLGADDLDHGIHVLLADVLALGFHHDPDDRLGAGFPHQNAPGVAQLGGDLRDGLLHVGVSLRRGLVGHPDVFQHLRIEGEAFAELAQGLLLRHHRLHDLQAGEDAVAGGGVLGEDDVAALLAAQTAAVGHHVFVDVL